MGVAVTSASSIIESRTPRVVLIRSCTSASIARRFVALFAAAAIPVESLHFTDRGVINHHETIVGIKELPQSLQARGGR